MNKGNENIGSEDLTLSAFVFAVVLCIMFGANTVAGKFVMQGFGQLTTAGVRFSISGIAIFLWCKFTGRSLYLSRKQLSQVIIAALMLSPRN